MVLEKILESPLDFQEIWPVNPKGNQSWIFIGRTDAEAPILCASWCEEPTHWKRPWCWERLRAKGEAGDRGRDGWMASPIQWTWVWASSGRWWRTGKPGVLQSMESQRVRHNLATEQQRNVTSLYLWLGAMRNNVSCDGPTDSSALSFLDSRIWPWDHDVLEALAHSGSLLRTTI